MDLFDKKGNFRNDFDEPNIDLIPDNLNWDKLGPKILLGLKKDKRRRRFIWLWWTGILVLFIVIGIILIKNISSSNQVPSTISEEKTANDKIVSTNEKPKVLSEDHNTLDLSKENLNTEEHIIIAVNSEENTVIESISKRLVQPKKNTLIIKRGDQLSINAKSKKLNSQLVGQADLISTLNEYDNSPQPARVSELTNIGKGNDFQNVDFKDDTRFLDLNPLFSLPVVPLKTYHAFDLPDVTSDTILRQKEYVSNWQVQLSGGSNVFSNIAQTRNQMALAADKTLIGWQANLRLRKYITQSWSVQAGLEVKQLRYKSDFRSDEDVTLNRPNTLDTVFVSFQTREVSSTYRDMVPGLRQRIFLNHNKHTLIKLPLLFGYEIEKSGLGLALQTGLSTQLYRISDGKTIIQSGETILLNDSSLYNSSFQWSYLLESQLSYSVTKRSKIIAILGLDHQINNWLVRDLGYQNRPTIMNVSLGVSWALDSL